MNRFVERFSLSTIVIFAVGVVLFATLTLNMIFRISREHREMERSAERQASVALDMLESVHSSAMLMRTQTADNDPAIDTLNMSMKQFSEQNNEVRLWLVMAQRVIDYQLANNQKEIEGPLDDIDRRALLERASQQEFTENGTLRITRPVILGVGSASDARCGGCHTTRMGITNGDVIGAYSAEVNMAAPIAAWHAIAIKIVVAGILITVFTLCLMAFLLHYTVLNPIKRLATAADEIAGGVADVKFDGANRRDCLGTLARSLNAFKLKIREQLDLEIETTRKNEALRIAHELRQNEQKLTQAANEAEAAFLELASHKLALDEHAIVAVTDTKGTITYANDKFCHISGYCHEELIGQNHRILNSDHHPEDFFTDMYKTVAGGRSWHAEIKNKNKDGSHYWLDTTITPFKDENGKVVQYIAIRTDITERKYTEQALQESKKELTAHRDHLQNLVDEATQELKAKAEELKEALGKEKALNKLQRDFVTMASHEFRTPLAIIDATAQRMKSRANTNRLTPEDAVHRVEKIRRAVQRMTRLMESTLDAARMEEGKIKVEIKPCDIGKVVGEVCVVQQEIAQTHVISCDLAELPKTIFSDADALDKVLSNLLSNAVKYAPNAPEIEVKARTEGEQVVISVCDHGVGIDGDEIGRIGERFFRARTSTGTAGTGIGLNLVKTLVEIHGGTVSVESQKGEGSTFTISLPIAGPDQSEQTATRVA